MIWVFKTSVADSAQAAAVKPLLNQIVTPEGTWNFDLEDCDKILRIDSAALAVEKLINSLHNQGILCEELPD